MRTQLSILLALSLLTLTLELTHALHGHEFKKTNGSAWLAAARKKRHGGCWFRPWMCRERFPPFFNRRLCCRNRCVDVSSDPNNCGLCGIRCPFSWRCCKGFCVDTMINPFHCGTCANRCPLGARCLYGLCGYAVPVPPIPFPIPFPPRTPVTSPPPPVVVFPPEPPTVETPPEND